MDRRRRFWTTQPDICGAQQSCGESCANPGLQLIGSSFVTDEWVRSLAINILMTDGRKEDIPCGYRPGSQGGHWSESFRQDSQPIGSTIRDMPNAPSIRQSVALARAKLQNDLARLVNMGLAQSVNVETRYLGGNLMSADITITAPDGTNSRVGLTGARNSNTWAWS